MKNLKKEIQTEIEAAALNDEDMEIWDQDQEDRVSDPQQKIRPWPELREQIPADIKKGQSTLSLSRLNQLLALSNFATLLIKENGWMETKDHLPWFRS
jgi:hypothetical protein